MDLSEKLERLPDRPGVYLYKDAKGQVVYVGKAASVRSRVRSYFQASRTRDAKTDALVDHIADIDYIVTANELEALILESNLVKRHRPRYNIILRDDKHYPFLKLTTNEEFPRLLVARRVQKDGATYYGPFYPATALRETLRLVRALFPLRTCSIKIDGAAERPCLQYYIHRCKAPCTGWETREGYDRTVKDVQAFLEGRDEDLARRLTTEMEEAAAQEKFERAGILRDQVQALNTVRERQKIISVEPEDQDILGLARQGLRGVRPDLLRAPRPPARSGGVLPGQAGERHRRRAALGTAAAVLLEERGAAARDPALDRGSGGGAARGVAGPAARGSRGAPRSPARAEARAGGHGGGERRARPPDPSPGAVEPAPGRRRGAPPGARAPGGPAPDRGLRHLEHPGTGGGRLHGRVGGRRHEEGRLQAVQDPHGSRRPTTSR